MVVPPRMSDEDTEIGGGDAHGEEAYAIWGSDHKLIGLFVKLRDDMIMFFLFFFFFGGDRQIIFMI